MEANLPTKSELEEFRTAVALARANYNGNRDQVRLLMQLVNNPDNHVYALRAIINVLLLELDGPKRDANEVLIFLAESLAVSDAQG
jgi:hypothetical protein